MVYINIKSHGKVETIDEFDTRAEAYKMLKEYRLSDNNSYYYLSQRGTKDWRDR